MFSTILSACGILALKGGDIVAKMSFSGIDEFINDLKNIEHVAPGCECPSCGQEFDLDLDADTVTCPHCGIEIAIEHEE